VEPFYFQGAIGAISEMTGGNPALICGKRLIYESRFLIVREMIQFRRQLRDCRHKLQSGRPLLLSATGEATAKRARRDVVQYVHQLGAGQIALAVSADIMLRKVYRQVCLPSHTNALTLK